uniref:Uncharacterized protein n=3 Tax=Schistocephalus solidus TaxID=70667 RepID=A0A0X3Q6A1_SCHSO
MQLDGQLHVKALYTAHNHPCIRKFLSAYAKFRRLDREKEKGVAGLISQLQPSTRRFKVYFQSKHTLYELIDRSLCHKLCSERSGKYAQEALSVRFRCKWREQYPT